MSSSSAPHTAGASSWLPDELHLTQRSLHGDNGIGLDAEALAAARAAEIEAAVAEAYARGLADGRTEGMESERARLHGATQALAGAVDALALQEGVWTENLEDNIAALATAIARQLVTREVSADVDVVGQLVRSALELFPVEQPVRVRINPADLAALTSVHGGTPPLPHRESTWLADPAIVSGGCVVEGRERIVDGRVDTALERVYRRLTHTHA